MQAKQKSADVQATVSGAVMPLPEAAPSRPKRASWLRRFVRNRKAVIGFTIVLFFILVAVLAPLIAPGNPKEFAGRANLAPSAEHLLGTSGQGTDVFRQLVWGTRLTLLVGFATGLLCTCIGTIVGLTAGYFGGWVDDVLSLLMNVVLIIPGLPLLVTLAAFLRPGPTSVVIVLTATGWAWPARVLRSQALSLRSKDFVSAAVVSGEHSWRIIFLEILPNMISVFAGSLVGATIYAIGADVGLAYLGLSDVGVVSWGTVLYWATTNSSMLVGAWWTFIPAGLCIALVAFALAMINYALDEVTNPRLRAEKEVSNALNERTRRHILITPVRRG